MIRRGDGVTRLKHLSVTYSDVSKCSKVPQEICHAIKEEFDGKMELKYELQREIFDRRVTGESIYDEFEGRGEGLNDEKLLAALNSLELDMNMSNICDIWW